MTVLETKTHKRQLTLRQTTIKSIYMETLKEFFLTNNIDMNSDKS